MESRPKCYVGMSGGVDSSVAAYLLKNNGYEVHGIYANCFYDDALCRNSEDHKDAVKVAGRLGIKLETKDYRKNYYDNVLRYFYSEYSDGRTPNPDVLCNSEIKFGVMANDVFDLSPENYLATGHYVGSKNFTKGDLAAHLASSNFDAESIDKIIGLVMGSSEVCRTFLLSGKDVTKDQSYFLYRLYDKTEKLGSYIFPLSEMTKNEVRALAKGAGIDVASKPDSQGICFVGDVKLREFLKDHVKGITGDVIDLGGNVIGKHSGIQLYTIGQRHGFTIYTYSGRPYYIVDKMLDRNILVVGNREDASTAKFTISNLCFPYYIDNFLEEFNKGNLTVRIRNLGRKIPCKVKPVSGQNASGKKYEVELSEPEFGVSAGQSAVFYIDRLMLGGGVIESSSKISAK